MMLSSRTSYYPDAINHHHSANTGIEFYRRSDGGIRMPLGHHSPLLQDHFEGGSTRGHLSRRATPSGSDTDGRSANVPPRKRVPVACERCRKRKIKCSGDESGGGCSNCRNAGLSGCHFQRVATIPDAPTYMAYRQEMRTRAHATHWHQGHHGHAQRYAPYSMPSPSHHYHRPSSSAYASFASSSPTNYGPHSTTAYGADYTTPYSTGVSQGVSWMRTGSYSSYYGHNNDTAATANDNQFASQPLPASFLLPNTDPMGSTTSIGYNTMLNPYGRSNSQVWADQSLLASAYGGEASTESAAAAYESSLQAPAAASQKPDDGVLYPLITSTLNNNLAGSSDRTLPTPGTRNYSQNQTSSAFDNLPLSAVSHRSSIGWSTDSGSGASHVSSQTSITGSTYGGPKHANDRSVTHRGVQNPQDPDYSYVGYGNSPQGAVTNNNLGVPEGLSMAYGTSNSMRHSSAATTTRDSGSSLSSACMLPSHHQRCRTISQEGTPLQHSNATSIGFGNSPINTDIGNTPSAANATNRSNISGRIPGLGVTVPAPTYSGYPYNASHNLKVDASQGSHGNSTRATPVVESSYSPNSNRITASATIEEVTNQPSPHSVPVSNYHAHVNVRSGGYTTTPHQGPTSSFSRSNLVVPSPDSQTRSTAISGEGTVRLTSVSSGVSDYTSARGSDGSITSMLSNFGGGADTLGLSVGYGTGGTLYGHDARAITGQSVGISTGRADANQYAAKITTYPEKDIVAGRGGIVNHTAGRLSGLESDIGPASDC